uniref:Roadblock/LC7 domain-containing protein n=1 Tax=candidate division WOR-3 bacterium TaxID=2052148 RepID=A0A7V3ZT03_UNCW3
MWDTLILKEKEIEKIQNMIEEFTLRAGVYSAMLSTLSGQLIASSGFKDTFSLLAVSALCAGIFQSTKELARIVGERGFRVFYQEGKKWNIYYILLEGDFFLAAFFDDRTILGIVDTQAKRFFKKFNEVLKEIYG